MSLEVGKVYEFDDWMFVVIRGWAYDVEAMLLLDRGRYKAGEVFPMYRSSAVGTNAREVK